MDEPCFRSRRRERAKGDREKNGRSGDLPIPPKTSDIQSRDRIWTSSE